MIPHLSERALILAPIGRDAEIAASMLAEAGLRSHVCRDLPDLLGGIDHGAGFALVTEEALHNRDLHPLVGWLQNQPEWSDFPFILLTRRGGGLERNPSASRYLEMLGNVNFLERPFHPTTLISLARSALRGRRRQYDARARLEELHRGAEKYRSLFDSIEAGFCIIEMIFDDAGKPVDYRFIETNPAFARHTGLSDAVGKSMRSLVPGHEQHWFDIYGQVARTGEAVRFEDAAEALGGYWYDVYAFRVGDPKAPQVAVLLNDITERRRMEAALRRSEERLRALNETLEERVQQRSHELELAQEALRQSQKLESMGQLTGGVAHDFNNLLTPIVGSLDLLHRRGLGTDRERRLIEGALQSADRAKMLVQRLLAFARRQPLQPTAIDIGGLVRDMRDLIVSTSGPRVQVELAVAEGLPAAHADANQIEMALLNLAVNARDAMPDGGQLRIGVTCDSMAADNRLRLREGRYVRLSVADTGIGMDQQTAEKAIEPFFTTKGVGQGTGLGLSMVHGLAAQLGGGLTIESAVGQGTTISLWLPTSEIEAGRDAAGPDTAPVKLDHGMALVVDDEELVRASTVHMLRELGYDVLEASSAEHALAIMKAEPDIDVLVTDHLMPGTTGTDLIEQARVLKPAIRALLISGYAENAGISAELPRLTKPFKQIDLAKSLAAL
ncbi:response regulator [Sphingobium indicum]|uniref:histidine kinase n=2 Tax=Sphingobium indicum TaxID=332055 RepID=A0A1L5BUG2_SPHIB|nr:ATP-binding protein [Sphingobium indicum]APL96490.1 histidine kinase [Sphingobium indicum B90A]KEY97310.1 histidine kinase [Sphingomonas sp. BHC-A]NYI23698.1 signal transduction histidine kinase/CheY-like chemotaxis protein [Sphingobium indicum]RYM00441.1 response regulator [Sphingobium indicum]